MGWLWVGKLERQAETRSIRIFLVVGAETDANLEVMVWVMRMEERIQVLEEMTNPVDLY